MAETGNYQLNQWESTDRILREDFNADNAKVDQALAAQKGELAALTAAVALCGNCKIAFGQYVGTGTYGANNPCTITFPGKPAVVFVQTTDRNSTNNDRLIFIRNSNWGFVFSGNIDSNNFVTWRENSLSWYNSTSAILQSNREGVTYSYAGIILTE